MSIHINLEFSLGPLTKLQLFKKQSSLSKKGTLCTNANGYYRFRIQDDVPRCINKI
jgi:hypothetical protein